ncbi:Protein of unknown function (DUF3343) [Lachnospiraceae bacterium JC7]|nr:Protein of unknown function (DUF3343) [Lachnospiraceae bacterium JC7]
MRNKHTDYMVFAFHTTTSAFATEKYCKQMGIEGRLIPIPRQLSAGCGIAFRMTVSEFEKLPKINGMQDSLPENCWMKELASKNIEVETIKKLNL